MAWCASLPPEAPFTGAVPHQSRPGRCAARSVAGGLRPKHGESPRSRPTTRSPPRGASTRPERSVGVSASSRLPKRPSPARTSSGSSPSPGSPSCGSHQGKGEPPCTALRLAVAAESGSTLRRARLLAGSSRSRSRLKDLESPGSASDELGAIAAYLRDAGSGRGRRRRRVERVGLPRATCRRPSRACGAPVRSGRSSSSPTKPPAPGCCSGSPLRAAGDEEDARLELRAALATFERLGATPDVRHVCRTPWPE